MEKHIRQLTIKNFKSIRQAEMQCSRINLIIGQPNVGKSNILEALSLFNAQQSRMDGNKTKLFEHFIRYNEFSELFFDQDIEEQIRVELDTNLVTISSYRDRFLLTL
ncbi:MAG: AAA family ATPase [Bacteroidota bacterium]